MQIQALIDHYLQVRQRPEAVAALFDALEEAERIINGNPAGGLPYPRPYPAMQALGFRWLKVRSYWIGWTMLASRPIVTNVLYASGDLPRRASTRVEGNDQSA